MRVEWAALAIAAWRRQPISRRFHGFQGSACFEFVTKRRQVCRSHRVWRACSWYSWPFVRRGLSCVSLSLACLPSGCSQGRCSVLASGFFVAMPIVVNVAIKIKVKNKVFAKATRVLRRRVWCQACGTPRRASAKDDNKVRYKACKTCGEPVCTASRVPRPRDRSSSSSSASSSEA